MEPKFPKFIQDELDRPKTREEANENTRLIEVIFAKSRIDPTDAALKLLFLQCANQERKIYALTDEIESLKKRGDKQSESGI